MHRVLCILFFLSGFIVLAQGQKIEQRLNEIQDSLDWLATYKIALEQRYNQLTCEQIIQELKRYGLPSTSYLSHKAFLFSYSEQHEQPEWVAHVIVPDVINLGSKRTNDFRIDPLVETGTADSIDYYAFDGTKAGDKRYFTYGYDRGHLAPSADFRWSKEAMSESYYYSNISPQLPAFNRGKWAELEGFLRKYVIENETKLIVLTAPILTDDLRTITQSPNEVSIPEQFVKIVYDPLNERTIGFVMDNAALTEPLSHYARTINEIEMLTGFNYFSNIEEELETEFSWEEWEGMQEEGNVEPVDQVLLPYKHFNSAAGSKQAGSNEEIFVCGTVVDSRYSRKGHAWLNVDYKYPNQIFSIMIRKEELEQFSFDPTVQYVNKALCFQGKVEQWGELIVMQIDKPERVKGLVIER